MVEHLPSKLEALSLNLKYYQKKKKKEDGLVMAEGLPHRPQTPETFTPGETCSPTGTGPTMGSCWVTTPALPHRKSQAHIVLSLSQEPTATLTQAPNAKFHPDISYLQGSCPQKLVDLAVQIRWVAHPKSA
jgi:hypothetical protein